MTARVKLAPTDVNWLSSISGVDKAFIDAQGVAEVEEWLIVGGRQASTILWLWRHPDAPKELRQRIYAYILETKVLGLNCSKSLRSPEAMARLLRILRTLDVDYD